MKTPRFGTMATTGAIPIIAALCGITLFKMVLAGFWGWTADIDIMRWSAEAFLAGKDILDPANTHRNPVFLPIGHHLIVAGALLLAKGSGLPFAFLIKVPAILGDLLVAALLRGLPRGGDRAALLYLASPVTFLLSVYHGQLHTLAAAGAVLTLRLAGERRLRPAGIALGLTVSVRQHFALLALPLLARLEEKSDFLRFAGPLAATVVAVNAALLAYGDPGRLFSPVSSYGMWGYTMLLLQAPRVLALLGFQGAVGAMEGANRAVTLIGPRVPLGWALLFSVWVLSRSRERGLDPWRAALLYCLGLYALAPGIGVQWLVWAVPFWLVVDRRGAALYSVLAGSFIAGSYWQWTLNAKHHVYSMTAHLDLLDRRDLAGILIVGLLGLSTWLYVCRAAWRLASEPAPEPT